MAESREQGTATVTVDDIDYWIAIVDEDEIRRVYLMKADAHTLRNERMLHVHEEVVTPPSSA